MKQHLTTLTRHATALMGHSLKLLQPPYDLLLIVGLLLFLGLILLAGLLLNNFTPGPHPASAITFVTVTPASQLNLSEGQRTRQTPPAPDSALTPPPAAGLPIGVDANEMGKIMVLEYHRIGYPEQRYQRTPDNLRADLQRLHQAGYYPVNFIDLIQGLRHVPAGKKPIVLTFDDSDISQFRLLPPATGQKQVNIDADSAVGIILNFHTQHGPDWPAKATFFVLGDDTANYAKIFGEPDWAKAKLQFLVDNGLEVGSHTVNHVDLSTATAERINWELAVSKHVIEELIPGYTVQSLSVPYGGFPYTLEFLRAGTWGDYQYTYAGNVAAWGGPTVSPFDPTFIPLNVPRLEVTGSWLDHWLTHFEQNPHEYYISDGDPNLLTVPEIEVAAEQ